MNQERFSNLTVLNSHKERTAKFASPPPRPNSNEVVTGPRTLKSAARALTTKLISLRAISLLFCLIFNFCKGV